MVGLSTEVSLRTHTGGRPLSAGVTTDLSPNGACVQLSAEEDLLGSELELRWLQSAAFQESVSTPLPATVCTVVGQVVWIRPAAPDARPGCVPVAGRSVLAGVRFLPVAKEAEDIIDHLLGQTQPSSLEATAGSPAVLSEFSECCRPSGLRIVICHDRPRVEQGADAPIVVLAPGYGEDALGRLRYEHRTVGQALGEVGDRRFRGRLAGGFVMPVVRPRVRTCRQERCKCENGRCCLAAAADG